MGFIKLILISLLSIASLFIITKTMGHKQVAQLDFFDYVCGITIGSIGAELATDLEAPWKSLTALIIYGAVSTILNLLTRRFPRSRKYINGTPTILMCDGKLYRENLKKSKLDLSEFLLLCREQGYFDISEIQAAIFEHNGKLSLLPKAANRPATPEDLCITVKNAKIGTELIMDGKVMGENLLRIGRDKTWLMSELKSGGYEGIKDILLLVYYAEEDRMTVFAMN